VPELPEVETVRDGLERFCVGRTVETVRVLHPRAVRRDVTGPAGFERAMSGRSLKAADRRGKYLWLTLAPPGGTASRQRFPGGHPPGPQTPTASPIASDRIGVGVDESLLMHLGMSGQLLVGEPDRPLSPHVRVRFTFTDGGPDLRFTDQRTFGHLLLAPLADGADGDKGFRRVPAPISHIAPDPLEEAFNPEFFSARLRKKKTGLKRALLDQSLISGIGNIYADEALWRAQLHWARPTETLRTPEISRLLAAVSAVLGEALTAGGTSFDALYVNVNGESGYFERSLNAYGRADEPCGRCGTPIRRDTFMNRSSYSCPVCQPRPRNARW
jgi:formamidopyrimidine-DNA glycosylase